MDLDIDAIAALSQGPAIEAADRATAGAMPGTAGLVALPNNFQTHDLERLLPLRRRARGTMTTSVVEHFKAYVEAHAEAGASVFVDPDQMTACAVLNLGTPGAPGHADNTAKFAPKATAAYKALGTISNGVGNGQQRIAEFLEDWAPMLACFRDGTPMETKHAIAAFRSITIEALRKTQSTEEQFSASRSALDQVRAHAGDNPLPTRIDFMCEPFVGLSMRTFSMRVAIHLGDKAPTISLRIIKYEEHIEEMAKELVGKVAAAMGDKAPVLIGSYSAK